jgi:hypothetical protein
MVALVFVAGFGLQIGYPSVALGAVGLGIVAAGGVLLAFGSPGGFPDPSEVATALRQLGFDIHDLEPAADQSWGTRRMVGFDADGAEIEVKAYGRDEPTPSGPPRFGDHCGTDDAGPGVAYTRMQAVEHEALMAMFAARAGVSVVQPLTAGLAGDDVAILAVPRPGPSLAQVPAAEFSDRTLVAIWRDLALLHDADMAHGSPNASDPAH